MLSRNLKVTLIEDNIAWADKEANMAQLRRNMQNMPDDTDLVILPELFSTGFMVEDRDAAAAVAERNTAQTMRQLHELAQTYRVGIVGSFLASTAAQLYNRAFFIEPNGEETFYDKHHIFTFAGEDKVFNAGRRAAPIVRFRGMNIKVVVCYDLRFPGFCRNHRTDYDVLVVVANWPQARQAAWRQLLIARALENECYVCGVNRCGTDPNGIDYSEGSSLVIDFKGKIIGQRMTSPIITADLSPALLAQFREKFPAWRDADDFQLLLSD